MHSRITRAIHCEIMRTTAGAPEITMRARQSGIARRIAPCALALAFLCFASATHLPGLGAAPGRRQSRDRRRHDDRCAEGDPRSQRSGIARRAAGTRHRRGGVKLRAAGAAVVIVASHAGGRCDRFDQPADLSSCDSESEIFRWLRRFERLGRLVESSRVRSGQRRLAAAGVGCV